MTLSVLKFLPLVKCTFLNIVQYSNVDVYSKIISDTTMTLWEEARLIIMYTLANDPEVTQLQFAERMDIGLGKSNYLLKARLEKGHIKANNFQSSDNKLGYLYLFTPEGASTKLKLTCEFIIRKEAEYQALITRYGILCIAGKSLPAQDGGANQPSSCQSALAY